LAARLGKAHSQAEAGQTDGAIQAIEQVIADAAPESIDLQARAHNVLGKCHLKAGSQKEALYAFLYVDVLCASAGDAHAEALFQLIPLFRAFGRDEDARQAQERLLERYPQSTWAKQSGGSE
jgi:TolA-binding protein